MINIDINKCNGCGLCINDCIYNDIIIVDKKASALNTLCNSCGHCIAVCPQNAVLLDNYDIKDVIEFNPKNFTIKPDNLLNSIKFRRSIRHFKKKKVEVEKIKKIIDVGRFTPTANNNQPLSFIVVQNRMEELTKITMDLLYDYVNEYETYMNDPVLNQNIKYINRWKIMYDEYKKGKDLLFYNAPIMIIILHDRRKSPYTLIDGGLAATNMELMANSLKLGVCHSGFFTFAAENQNIRDFLYLPSNKYVVTSLLIGYPDIKYLRTVPRKKPEIQWF